MKLIVAAFLLFTIAYEGYSQDIKVKAYYHGDSAQLSTYDPTKISHIIFCFGHLEGSRLKINDAKDTAIIKKMVNMKTKNPKLKVIYTTGYSPGVTGTKPAFEQASNFLPKPYSPSRLAELVRKCLDEEPIENKAGGAEASTLDSR